MREVHLVTWLYGYYMRYVREGAIRYKDTYGSKSEGVTAQPGRAAAAGGGMKVSLISAVHVCHAWDDSEQRTLLEPTRQWGGDRVELIGSATLGFLFWPQIHLLLLAYDLIPSPSDDDILVIVLDNALLRRCEEQGLSEVPR